MDLPALGERSIFIDCDVMQADGGTRCAAITGGFVALVECLARLQDQKKLLSWPVKDFLAAISVGVVNGKLLLDLDYDEDSQAEVDVNVVMTMQGNLVELQATGEKRPFTSDELEKMHNLAKRGIAELISHQKEALEGI